MKAKILKTIGGRILKLSSNKRERTYTLQTEAAVYKTIPFDKEEFESARKWTGNDWENFLRNQNDEYYRIRLL